MNITEFLNKALFSICIFCANYTYAGANGIIKGTLKDSATRDALPFVVVALEDSASKQFSTISDQFGNFKFTNLNSGSYQFGNFNSRI